MKNSATITFSRRTLYHGVSNCSKLILTTYATCLLKFKVSVQFVYVKFIVIETYDFGWKAEGRLKMKKTLTMILRPKLLATYEVLDASRETVRHV